MRGWSSGGAVVMGLALAGCAADGRPEVLSASLALGAGPADAPAEVMIKLRLHAVDDQEVTGVAAGLYEFPVFDDPPLVNLAVALPAGFNPQLDADDERDVMLDNAGTRNADLEPFCGQAHHLFVRVAHTGDPVKAFAEEPHKANFSRPVTVTVACATP